MKFTLKKEEIRGNFRERTYTERSKGMKKILLIGIAVVIAIGLVACGGTGTTESGGEMQKEDTSNLPEWVMNMEMSEDVIYGIGYAKMSNLNTSRTTALARARTDVSFQIKSTIQAMMTDYQQEAGVDDNSQTINFVESVSKQLTDNVLSGLTPDKMAVMDDNGVWVRVIYRKADFLDDAKETFERNEDAAFAEFKASQAVDKLNYELENNPPESEPVTK